MRGEQPTEIILDAPEGKEWSVEDLKCGCCKKAMKPMSKKEMVSLFERQRQRASLSECFVCGWCVGHCKCGQLVSDD